MRLFQQQNELIRFSDGFVGERIDALEKDVKHCLCEPFAPFPAIVYCFSTIDFLGALFEGNATKKANTTKQSSGYMHRFMHYTHDQATLLMQIFRHKIVHMAQPKAISEFNGKKVAWRYWHENAERHLKLTKLKEPVELNPTSELTIVADHEFEIGIMNLVKDISISVKGASGYLHSLKSDVDLQDRFEKAVSEIYAP